MPEEPIWTTEFCTLDLFYSVFTNRRLWFEVGPASSVTI
jgi:hypothetical protein